MENVSRFGSEKQKQQIKIEKIESNKPIVSEIKELRGTVHESSKVEMACSFRV